jgi:hypothetical protein
MSKIITARETDRFDVRYNLENVNTETGEVLDVYDQAATQDGSMQIVKDHASRNFEATQRHGRTKQITPRDDEYGWLWNLFYGGRR